MWPTTKVPLNWPTTGTSHQMTAMGRLTSGHLPVRGATFLTTRSNHTNHAMAASSDRRPATSPMASSEPKVVQSPSMSDIAMPSEPPLAPMNAKVRALNATVTLMSASATQLRRRLERASASDGRSCCCRSACACSAVTPGGRVAGSGASANFRGVQHR